MKSILVVTDKTDAKEAIQSSVGQDYDVENQRQILQSLSTLKNELNFSFQDDLRKELERFNWFNMRFGC